jgi:rod shape-determining protein MreD
MILSTLAGAALAFLLAIVQSTWLDVVSVAGAIPDISLLVILWISYRNSRGEGPAAGFLSGIATDFISSAPIGYNAFVTTFAAYLASLLQGSIRLDRIILPFMLAVGGTLAKALGATALSLLFGSGKVFAPSFAEPRIWVEVLYNGLLAPPVFLALRFLDSWLVTEGRRT